jgi:hypothetical protein
MLKLLEESEEIEAAFHFLKERFMSAPFRTVSVTIPFYRRDLTVEARWFPDHRFWIAYDPDERMMFGGAEKLPEPCERVTLTLELAIPEGIHRYIPGAFAEGECGNLLLVHRGGFGGGNKGIGRKVFLERFGGTILTVIDGDRQADVAVVAALGSIHFLHQVAWFLREVDKMRKELP